MKKKCMYIGSIFLFIMVIILLYKNFDIEATDINEQVANSNAITRTDYKKIGDDFKSKIFEKYDVVKFGKYKSDKLGIIKKPIDWIILFKDEKKAILISKYILDVTCFDTDKENNYWEKSKIRKFLNEEFIDDIFSNEEKSKIIPKVITNDTVDLIYCLSEIEYNNYFYNDGAYDTDFIKKLMINEIDEYEESKDNGVTEGTKYAKQKGLYVFNESGTSNFWLRDSGDELDYYCKRAKIVDYYGNVTDDYVIAKNGIRPVIEINLE